MKNRLDGLFWRGLTALAFGATVALMFVKPAHAAPQPLPCAYEVR